MTPEALFVGGPKDGERIRLPDAKVQNYDPIKVPPVGSSSITYFRMDVFRYTDAVVYAVEGMTPRDVMFAMISRYPTPNPHQR